MGPERRYPHHPILVVEVRSYLDVIVLRLYPSVPLNSRHAVRATTLPHGGGPDGSKPIIVSEGEAVGYSTYELHRQKHLYGADAEAFRPERWDESLPDDSNLKNIGSGYLPFNTGPRVCLGRKLSSLLPSVGAVRGRWWWRMGGGGGFKMMEGQLWGDAG